MKNSINIAVNFISSKDINEERVMYLESDNMEVMAYDKAGEVTEELFE